MLAEVLQVNFLIVTMNPPVLSVIVKLRRNIIELFPRKCQEVSNI